MHFTDVSSSPWFPAMSALTQCYWLELCVCTDMPATVFTRFWALNVCSSLVNVPNSPACLPGHVPVSGVLLSLVAASITVISVPRGCCSFPAWMQLQTDFSLRVSRFEGSVLRTLTPSSLKAPPALTCEQKSSHFSVDFSLKAAKTTTH